MRCSHFNQAAVKHQSGKALGYSLITWAVLFFLFSSNEEESSMTILLFANANTYEHVYSIGEQN